MLVLKYKLMYINANDIKVSSCILMHACFKVNSYILMLVVY